MSTVAARSFGQSASVIRPTSPYLNAPPLAHCTTSPMACFLVVATRRATVRESLRSWLNPEVPLPLLCAGGEAGRSALGLADPFPPETLVPFPGGGVSLGEFEEALPGVVSVGSAHRWKCESALQAIANAPTTDWIPAFGGMSSVPKGIPFQMTPAPGRAEGSQSGRRGVHSRRPGFRHENSG
jgi:hypothetical protein